MATCLTMSEAHLFLLSAEWCVHTFRIYQTLLTRLKVCMMLDIARGLQYLHSHKPSVIHRDCKSSNILVTSKGVAKITDFGLAKVKQSTRSMVRSLVGTVNWQAPELWHPHPKYNHKVDVFSCAMVFWEMMQWHLPNPKFPWEVRVTFASVSHSSHASFTGHERTRHL